LIADLTASSYDDYDIVVSNILSWPFQLMFKALRYR
jgi:hypothetical protein